MCIDVRYVSASCGDYVTYRKRKKMTMEIHSVIKDNDKPTVSMMRAPNAILFITCITASIITLSHVCQQYGDWYTGR